MSAVEFLLMKYFVDNGFENDEEGERLKQVYRWLKTQEWPVISDKLESDDFHNADKFSKILRLFKREMVKLHNEHIEELDELIGYEGKNTSKRDTDEEGIFRLTTITRLNTRLNCLFTKPEMEAHELLQKITIAEIALIEKKQKCRILSNAGINIPIDAFIRDCFQSIPNFELFAQFNFFKYCRYVVDLEDDTLSEEQRNHLIQKKQSVMNELVL
jgi:hypothetical protein